MNVSWQWLTELVDLKNIEPEYLAERLTLAGFEVEAISQNHNNHTILEISTTANRVDVLSVIGLAREISAILDRPLIKTLSQYNLSINHQGISSQYSECSDYLNSIITNLTITKSPVWLQQKLIDSDILPKNILEDIKNFVYLKWSQHIDFFDLDTFDLDNYNDFYQRIKIESSNRHQQFTTNDNVRVSLLDTDIITINYSNVPIAIAGIATSNKHSIKKHTINILAHIGKFQSNTIGKISEKLNLASKNSFLHKKEIGASDLLSAYSECIFLISRLCKGSVDDVIYISNTKPIYERINLQTENINKILGQAEDIRSTNQKIRLNNDFTIKILKRLQFIVQAYNNNIVVRSPLNRIGDISREIDLIEEVSRIYGFDKFTGPIPFNTQYGKKRDRQYQVSNLRSMLRTAGLNEIIHSSLVDKKYTDIVIHNPLINEYDSIRSNLLSNIIDAHSYNLQQGNSSLEVFEIGRVFGKSYKPYKESINLAGIMGGNKNLRSEWGENARQLSWFEAKGKMEEIFNRLNTNIRWKSVDISFTLLKELKFYFHPKRISILYLYSIPVGIFGQLTMPWMTSSLSSIKIYGFEILLGQISIEQNKINHFKPYSKYPAVTRDININIAEKVSFEMIINAIQQDTSPLIESIDLFNLYKNTMLENSHKNLGFRLTYRSTHGTLTNKEIDELEAKIKDKIRNKFQE
jgi:phenylalanyl-tRNA synthetase beta chain